MPFSEDPAFGVVLQGHQKDNEHVWGDPLKEEEGQERWFGRP